VNRRRLAGEVLDVAGVAALMGTSEKAIRARVARQTIPFRRWGGRVVFLRGEVLAFLARLDGVSLEDAVGNAMKAAAQ
jgi:hypothetical protein